MSDTDDAGAGDAEGADAGAASGEAADGGSASFDKEAERQRLREKYEEESGGRAQTQKMSELLLQGATMTNSHCDDCGNPIFRYDGRTFCPICDDPNADDRTGSEASAGGAEGSRQAAAGQSESAPARAATADTAAGDAAESAEGADTAAEVADPPGAAGEGLASTGRPETTDGPSRSQEAPQRGRESAQGGQQPSTQTGAGAGPTDAARSVATAQDSLARTLADLAAQAESTGDVGRRRELLAAAREAAEALAETRRLE